MNIFNKMIINSTVFLLGIGLSSASGQDLVANRPVKGEILLNSNGQGSPLKAQFLSATVPLAVSNYLHFVILREPQTGYTYWMHEVHPTEDAAFWGFTSLGGGRAADDWGRTFWIIRGVGMVRILDGVRLQITDVRTANLDDAQQQLVAGFSTGQKNDVWPMEQHQKEVELPLPQALGREFFFIPGSARVPPAPKVVALGFTNKTWSIRLASSVVKTNAVADVELDSDFKIIKASRSDK